MQTRHLKLTVSEYKSVVFRRPSPNVIANYVNRNLAWRIGVQYVRVRRLPRIIANEAQRALTLLIFRGFFSVEGSKELDKVPTEFRFILTGSVRNITR